MPTMTRLLSITTKIIGVFQLGNTGKSVTIDQLLNKSYNVLRTSTWVAILVLMIRKY